MKRTILTVLMVLVATAVVIAQEKIDVKGGWNLSIETPNGAVPITLKFEEVDGEKISGKLFTPQGDLPVTGKFAGKEISFSGTFEGPNGSIALTFSGTLENADSMSGTADFGGRGSGKWSATRVK